MDSCLALQIFSKHLTLEVDFLQAVFKVHYTLRGGAKHKEEVKVGPTVHTQIMCGNSSLTLINNELYSIS